MLYLHTAVFPVVILLYGLFVWQRASSEDGDPPVVAQVTVNEASVEPDEGETVALTEVAVAAPIMIAGLTSETMEPLTRQPGVYVPAAEYVQVAFAPSGILNHAPLELQRASRVVTVPLVEQVSVIEAFPLVSGACAGVAEAETPAGVAESCIAIAVSSIFTSPNLILTKPFSPQPVPQLFFNDPVVADVVVSDDGDRMAAHIGAGNVLVHAAFVIHEVLIDFDSAEHRAL